MCPEKYQDGEQTQNLGILQHFKELEMFNLKKAQRGNMKKMQIGSLNTSCNPLPYFPLLSVLLSQNCISQIHLHLSICV